MCQDFVFSVKGTSSSPVGYQEDILVKEEVVLMHIKENEMTAELFHELYTSVGWEPPFMDQIEEALSNTLATFGVYDENE